MIAPEELCRHIHKMLAAPPPPGNPSEVPFENGPYFFYEQSETSEHDSEGRIVRIGRLTTKNDNPI